MKIFKAVKIVIGILAVLACVVTIIHWTKGGIPAERVFLTGYLILATIGYWIVCRPVKA